MLVTTTKPSISVVMPFRNEERYLDESLRSILSQTFADWELIAIDDHSTDGSEAIVRRAADSDPRIRLETNTGNGLVSALNHGIRVSRARFVARMDADDISAPDRLSIQLARLEQDPAVGLVASRVRIFPRKSLRAGYREYERWQNRVVSADEIGSEIYFESPFAHPSVVIRRDLLEHLGGYRDGAFPEDYDLWLRMHARGVKMEKCEDVLLLWRDRPDRISRIDPRYGREAFDRLRARYLARDDRLENRSLVIWGAGPPTRRRARHLLREGVPVDAWIDIDPAKIGRSYDGRPVHAPDWLASLPRRPMVLVYVKNHGARDLIADRLESFGYVLGPDWLPVG